MELNNSNSFSDDQSNLEIINFQTQLVGYNKKVLSIGRNTQINEILKKQDCDIIEFELNVNDTMIQNSISKTSSSDQESLDFKKLENEKFDVVLVNDILLTLKKPKQFFQNILPFLNKNGDLVCSLPNITNANTRIHFLNGNIGTDYFNINGSTFLTFSQVLTILSEIHFSVVKLYRIKHNFFPHIDYNKDFGLPVELIECILSDPEASTSNYIFKATSGDSVDPIIRKSLEVFHNDVVTKELKKRFINYTETIAILKQTIKDKDNVIQSLVEQTIKDKDTKNKYKPIIENLFEELLQRPADIFGLRNYTSLLQNGKMTVEGIRNVIMDSKEYRNLHGLS